MSFEGPGKALDAYKLIDNLKAKTNEELLKYHSDLKITRDATNVALGLETAYPANMTILQKRLEGVEAKLALIEGEMGDRKIPFEK